MKKKNIYMRKRKSKNIRNAKRKQSKKIEKLPDTSVSVLYNGYASITVENTKTVISD